MLGPKGGRIRTAHHSLLVRPTRGQRSGDYLNRAAAGAKARPVHALGRPGDVTAPAVADRTARRARSRRRDRGRTARGLPRTAAGAARTPPTARPPEQARKRSGRPRAAPATTARRPRP